MRIDSLYSFLIDIKKKLIIYNSILLRELDEARPGLLINSYSTISKHLLNNLFNYRVSENRSLGDLLEHLEQELTISPYRGQSLVEFLG